MPTATERQLPGEGEDSLKGTWDSWFYRTSSTGMYSSEGDNPQLTQKLRVYTMVQIPWNSFDGRNCTVREFFPLTFRVLKVLNAGKSVYHALL